MGEYLAMARPDPATEVAAPPTAEVAAAAPEPAPPTAAELFPSLEKLARARRGHKVPFVQQLEATDCGAACLTMVLGHLGRDVPLDEVREAAGVSGRDGVDANAIVRAAEWYGLRSRASCASTGSGETIWKHHALPLAAPAWSRPNRISAR
jgi:hypothetical protein